MANPEGCYMPGSAFARQENNLLENELAISPYFPIRTIGKGQRSFVIVARSKSTGELVAIRFIPRGWEPRHTKYICREILNHQELSLSKHPHIVEFKEVFLTARYLAEVLEYVEGETLQVFLEKVGGKVIEGLARFIFQQLVIALDFCHRKGKVNRDIKLSNILLSITEGQLPLVKLCDFGVSKDTYRHSEPHSQVGTALFVAPEVMQNFSGGRYDGQAADVWACGVCLFIMLFGRHPYLRPEDAKLNEQQQMIKLFQRMMQNQIEFPQELVSSLSPECVDLLTRMLKTDPNHRANMADIQRHTWFTTALPEGAGMMNDVFMAEESASLSPQSHSQIEALVSLAARREELQPTVVQLPSHASRLATRISSNTSTQGSNRPPSTSSLTATSGASRQMQGGMVGMNAGGAPGMQVAVPPMGSSPRAGAGSGSMHSLSHHQMSLGQSPPNPTPSPTPSVHQSYLMQQDPALGMQTMPQYPGGGGGSYSQHHHHHHHQQQHMHAMQQQQQQQQQMAAAQQMHHHHQQQQQLKSSMSQPMPGSYNTSYMGQPQHHHHQQGGSATAGYPPTLSLDKPSNTSRMGMAQHQMPTPPNNPMSMIPDLDAMIMSMPETDLLQAATIDLRPQTSSQGAVSGGVAGSGGNMYGGNMQNPSHLQDTATGGQHHHHHQQMPSVTGPSQQQQQQQGNTSMRPPPVMPSHRPLPPGMVNSIAPLAPGSVSSLPNFSGNPLQTPPGLHVSPALVDVPTAPVVDATPFLYEGNDDDLPMVGSVSAVMPKFDWGSFNAPLLSNHDSLQASQHFQASRFARACRDVSAKMSESGLGLRTPSGLAGAPLLDHQDSLLHSLGSLPVSMAGMGVSGNMQLQ